MMFLPIVERELRVASRQWRSYWGRTVVGSVALVVTLYLIWLATEMRGAGTGAIILQIASYLTFGFCLFAGLSRSVDCISSEKREDTLGLLFLTHLKGHDVVLGKLVANSLHALLFLVTCLPILAIPIMLGGVSGGELIRVPISLLNALLFSLSIGLLTSTIGRVQRKVVLGASLVISLVTLFPPGLAVLLRYKYNLPLAATVVSLPSPLFAHQMSLSGGFGLSGRLFLIAIVLQFSLSAVALTVACLILPRAWQVKSGRAIGWKERFRRWTLGHLESRHARRTRYLARNPIFWLGARDRFGPLWPPLFMIVSWAFALGCVAYYQLRDVQAFVVFCLALGLVDFYFRARVATLSATLFSQERQMGTWELILSTPLSVPEIIGGNWRAIRHQLLVPYFVHLLSFGGALWYAASQLDAGSANLQIGLLFGFLSAGEFLILGYVGMWRGMAAHNALSAPGQALVRVTVVPWLVWLLLLPVINGSAQLREFFEQASPYGFLGTTGVVWTLSTAAAAWVARRNLRNHFRCPDEAPSLPRKLGAILGALLRAERPGANRPFQPALTMPAAREK